METTIQFSVQNLLRIKHGKVSGAMSPVLFAQEVTEQMGETFNRLARIRFTEEGMLQRSEDGGYTGHDTLVIGMQHGNDLHLGLWVDEGSTGMPVAMAFSSDREVTITPVYRKSRFAKRLTCKDLKAIFEYLFDNPSFIEPAQVD